MFRISPPTAPNSVRESRILRIVRFVIADYRNHQELSIDLNWSSQSAKDSDLGGGFQFEGGGNALAFLATLYPPFPVLAGLRSDSSNGSVDNMGGGSF
jgi:hypothetical protein